MNSYKNSALAALHGSNGFASFCQRQKLGRDKNYTYVIFIMPPFFWNLKTKNPKNATRGIFRA